MWFLLLVLAPGPSHAQAATLVADFAWDVENPSTADVINFRSTSTSSRPIVNCDWQAMVEGRLRTIPSQCEPSHRFERPGTYDVTFIVTNDWGETNQTTKRIEIANQLPLANLSYFPKAPTTDDHVTFRDASMDPDGSIETYRWQAQGRVGVESSFVHRFTDAGTHRVRLAVQEDSGGIYVVELLLFVQPGLPAEASFTHDPLFPAPGDSVRFMDTSRPAGGDRVDAWTWTFSDGHITQGRSVTHSFREDGIYRVVLTIETDGGQILMSERNIVVQSPVQFNEVPPPALSEMTAPLALLIVVCLFLLAIGWRNRQR